MSTLRGAVIFCLSCAPAALCGGSAENALLIVDPSSADSMLIGNSYRFARDIPESNVVYIDPTASSYDEFIARNAAAIRGLLAGRGIADHIDYIVIANPRQCTLPAEGIVWDGCWPVTKFSLSGAYSTLPLAESIRAGVSSNTANHYASLNPVVEFSANTGWSQGQPTSADPAPRYFIGAVLGYSGPIGNTTTETLALIARSVAADGTRPPGTFYFMRTADNMRSSPRHGYFPGTIADIQALGGQAVQLNDWMPYGRLDCLGVMTGAASPGIANVTYGLVPGAFCDHMTSFAAAFDVGAQEKVSAWIRKGASGTWGTVEEPCATLGKFPNPRVHLAYFAGATLGEAVLRNVSYLPFQGLLYGDPLTRPFAYVPLVSVAAPIGVVSGTVTLVPAAAATAPGAAMERLDLLIDGVRIASAAPGEPLAVDTLALCDGWHDVRVLARDNTPLHTTGRWVGSMVVRNRQQSASLGVEPAAGNLSTLFHATASAAANGAPVIEMRLVQNGRVVAAAAGGSASLTVCGATLGAGTSRVFAEALLAGGAIVRSEPTAIVVAATGQAPPIGTPAAFGYTRMLASDHPTLVELPATCSADPALLTFELLDTPARAAILGAADGPALLLAPHADAHGEEIIRFRVHGPGGASNIASLRLAYGSCPEDIDGDGLVSLSDLSTVLSNYGSANATAAMGDVTGDAAIGLDDLTLILRSFMTTCAGG